MVKVEYPRQKVQVQSPLGATSPHILHVVLSGEKNMEIQVCYLPQPIKKSPDALNSQKQGLSIALVTKKLSKLSCKLWMMYNMFFVDYS